MMLEHSPFYINRYLFLHKCIIWIVLLRIPVFFNFFNKPQCNFQQSFLYFNFVIDLTAPQ